MQNVIFYFYRTSLYTEFFLETYVTRPNLLTHIGFNCYRFLSSWVLATAP